MTLTKAALTLYFSLAVLSGTIPANVPVCDNHTRTGRAENRCVVVTLLQNKGIAR